MDSYDKLHDMAIQVWITWVHTLDGVTNFIVGGEFDFTGARFNCRLMIIFSVLDLTVV